MEIRQFKLANDDEIMCEVVEYHEEDDAIVIRKTMKMVRWTTWQMVLDTMHFARL